MSNIRAGSVIIYRETAYIPTTAQLTGEGAGVYLAIEPVYIANLTLNDLTEALERVKKWGNPSIPTPTREEFKNRIDPVLKASGARSWNALAKHGASYGIEWQDDNVVLYLSKKDARGRFASGIGPHIKFDPNVGMRAIAAAILDDIRLHPEALQS